MPDDPIAEVQALVGCVHKWVQVREFAGRDDVTVYLECIHCETNTNYVKEPPRSAPDCSTLWGALQAAKQLDDHIWIRCSPDIFVWDDSTTVGYHHAVKLATERAAASAVCELILQALQAREK